MITVHYTQANLEMFGHAGLEPRLAKWLAEPPEPKRSQVANIRVLQAKLCPVLGLQLLKNAMRMAGRRDFSLSRLHFGKGRKPYAPGLQDFNIAHSKDPVTCATTDKGNIGIDIEQMREVKMDPEANCRATGQAGREYNVRSLSITSLLPTPASDQERQRTEAGS